MASTAGMRPPSGKAIPVKHVKAISAIFADIREQPRAPTSLFAVEGHHLQIQSQICQRPFVAMPAVVLIAMLLDGNIGEVDKLVVHLSNF